MFFGNQKGKQKREKMYLAGDIGGTKTHLAIFKKEGRETICVKEKKFSSQKYPNLRSIVKEFLTGELVKKACFGIAGPVRNGKSQATNLPWVIDTGVLSTTFHFERVSLINDLEANAYGVRELSENELFVLNKGNSNGVGNQAIISAGTGLGEAGIFFDGKHYHPFACEGGHSDFAPRHDIEDELLLFLRKKFTHVSYERILSGPGLYNVYEFIVKTKKKYEEQSVFDEITSGDSPKLITEKGLSKESQACAYTLELFVSIYGAEVGNMALKMLAFGGVFIGGGIAPKILEVIKKGSFFTSFKEKGRFSGLLQSIPIHVILNDKTALLGAMVYARDVM